MKVPEKILDKHLGILGINGSGKTYTAKGCVETLLEKKERVCIIDPTGVWWGLKSSATGKSGAFPVVVFGGEHADLPISGLHGETIAEAIGTSNTPAIIDTSLMRGSERTKFFTDFAETLRIKNSGPLHLFIDEAHLFCPQGRVSDPHSAQMLHAANNLISLGRARGLRVTLISQRPAKMHKDSLTQVHTLIAMRLIAPQDRAAVEDWIADQADVKRGKEIIASLPSLKTGEGYLWAPELGILERMKFPKISTFDSSATPDGDGKGEGPVLKPIDLSSIEGRLANIKTEAVRNDPLALKRRIAELEKQLREKPTADVNPKATETALQSAYQQGVDAWGIAFESWQATIAQKVFQLISAGQLEFKGAKKVSKTQPARLLSNPTSNSAPKPIAHSEHGGDLGRAEQRVVDSIGFWKSIGTSEPTKPQVAAVSGYSVRSSGFEKTLSILSTKGIISRTASGLSLSNGHAANTPDLADAKNKFLSVLGGAQRRVLDAFEDGPLSKDEIAERSGYSVTSSGFEKTLSQLSTINVVIREGGGVLRLSEWAQELLS